MERRPVLLEWRLGHLADPDAALRARRTDRDEAGVAAEPAPEAREAHLDEAAGRGHTGEVRDPLSLGVAVMHEPVLAHERGCRVRVERLVPVEQDMAPKMQELQRVE